ISACAGVTLRKNSREHPRNGPPEAVSTSLRTSVGCPARSACARAECSESTGTICPGRASRVTRSPPTIKDSLFASARIIPRSNTASVGRSPTEPVMALRTTSASSDRTSASVSSIPTAVSFTPTSRARAASPLRRAPTRRPTTSNRSRLCRITSRACVPIEPDDPRITILRTVPLYGAVERGGHGKQQCTETNSARRTSARTKNTSGRSEQQQTEGIQPQPGRVGIVKKTTLAGCAASPGFLQPDDMRPLSDRFTPGFIVSDEAFFDSAAMTEQQIQRFIESVPCTPSDSVSPCLARYTQDTPWEESFARGHCQGYTGATREPASRIIKKVAVSCGISPRTLLVLVQKEQSLLTEPSTYGYQRATAYACPDPAACDTQYFGFFNQVYNAAWQFRQYTEKPDRAYKIGTVTVR